MGWKHGSPSNGWDLPLPIGMVVNGRTMKGMLGGPLSLKEGAARTAVCGRDALVLEPGTVLSIVIRYSPRPKSIQLVGWFQVVKWRVMKRSRVFHQGAITLHSSTEPLVITNFRYYNWNRKRRKKAYDAETDIVRLPVADQQKHGLVVSLSADDFVVNDTVPYLKNRGSKRVF